MMCYLFIYFTATIPFSRCSIKYFCKQMLFIYTVKNKNFKKNIIVSLNNWEIVLIIIDGLELLGTRPHEKYALDVTMTPSSSSSSSGEKASLWRNHSSLCVR